MQIKKKIVQLIKRKFFKLGLKTHKHIVVFESDDWGADRNYSKENFEKLLKLHPEYQPKFYQKCDILESDEDVKELTNVLKSVKDSEGNPCVFTLNFAMFNLDFKNNNNGSEKFVSIIDYYKESKESKNVLSEVKLGVKEKCFSCQLHAREHIRLSRLRTELEEGNKLVEDAYALKILGVSGGGYSGMDTLNTDSEESKKMLEEAMTEFQSTFGNVSETYIAPCYTWKDSDEKVLERLGVNFLQGRVYQNKPTKDGKIKKIYHKFGEKSKVSNLRYFYRNVYFEPSRDRMIGKTDEQILEDTLKDIRLAFKNKKPAVICSHRVNYVSGIEESNRTDNLHLLKMLLENIVSEFDDVVFMDSATMCKEMLKK